MMSGISFCWIGIHLREPVKTDRIETDGSFSFMEQKKPFNFKNYLRNRLEL